MHWFIVILLFLSGTFSYKAKAQENYAYNLSTLNGMPTNYVYSAITDKWGYLWMATEKGVVKYNGYSLKLFNYADGLIDEDVYGLQKDNIGRIWLYGFGGKLGYIYNDKYKLTINASQHPLTRVHYISPYKNTILFTTPVGLYTVRNDSAIYLQYKINTVNNNGEAFRLSESGFTKFLTDGYKVTQLKNCPIKTNILREPVVLNRFILFYTRYSDTIHLFDPENCKLSNMFLYNEHGQADTILYLSKHDPYKLLALSKTNIYEIDTSFRVSRVPIRSIVDPKDRIVLNYMNAPVWGECLSTRHNGIYVLYPKTAGLVACKNIDLSGYKTVGTTGDNISYWWNPLKKQLARIDGGRLTVKQMSNISSAYNILPFNDSLSILNGGTALFLMNNRTLTMYRPVSYVFIENKIFTAEQVPIPAQVVFTDSLNGFTTVHMMPHKMTYNTDKKLLTLTSIDTLPYRSLYYDNFKNLLVACGESIYLHHTKTGRGVKIPMLSLNKLGIRKIVNLIFIPGSDNVLIQDHDAIYNYNLRRHRLAPVLRHLNMTNSILAIKNGRIIVAGKFGITTGNITSEATISNVAISRNIKEQYYSDITGMQVVGDTLHLNTDRGFYMLSMSHISPGNTTYKYTLLGYYADSVFSIKPGDTIYTTQKNNRIQYDVVNAYGSGRLKFSYRTTAIDSAWANMIANEMIIPELKPGKYHKIYLSISDDAWNSDPIPLYFYIEPYWWQTQLGKSIILIGAVLLLFGLLLSVFVITRAAIMRNNRKRNKLLELEVKSVYAQINPHFIFNSLNSALSYIELNKNDEAHIHISRFSGLLRGFIKSSRNRYTTIAEEVVNLKHYIELEQTRFASIFTYKIVVPPEIQNEQIPTLLLQPLVENAINHGLLPKEEGGQLEIRFDKSGKELTCIIEDNGIGRIRSREMRDEHSPRVSYGSLLISDLIDVFNRYEKTKIDITYIDKTGAETGLIVKLTFKNP